LQRSGTKDGSPASRGNFHDGGVAVAVVKSMECSRRSQLHALGKRIDVLLCLRLVECVLWSAPRLRGLSFSLRALTSALVKSNSLHRFWISQQL